MIFSLSVALGLGVAFVVGAFLFPHALVPLLGADGRYDWMPR